MSEQDLNDTLTPSRSASKSNLTALQQQQQQQQPANSNEGGGGGGVSPDHGAAQQPPMSPVPPALPPTLSDTDSPGVMGSPVVQSDNANFFKLFPNINPALEQLIEDYQCSYSKNKLHRMGRVYLTNRSVCFSSPFCESFTLAWLDIIDIQKKANLLLLEAIAIRTSKEEYFFTAFLYRDLALKSMTSLWNAARYNQSVSPKDQETSVDNFPTTSPPALMPKTAALPPAADSLPLPIPTVPTTTASTAINEPQQQNSNSPRQQPEAVPAPAQQPPPQQQPPSGGNNNGTSEAAPVPVISPTPPTPIITDLAPSGEGKNNKRATIVSGQSSPQQSPSSMRRSTGDLTDTTLLNVTHPAMSTPVNHVAVPPSGQETVSSPAPTERRGHARTPSQDDTTKLSDFHKNFPTIPPQEKVVADYQCSFIPPNHIHRMGRLYITANNICFFSMFCGSVVIPFPDVVSIEKKESMMILNGLIIVTNSTTYEFTSFYNREGAHESIQQQWATHKGIGVKAAPPSPPPQVSAAPMTTTAPVLSTTGGDTSPSQDSLAVAATSSAGAAPPAEPTAPTYPTIDVATITTTADVEGASFHLPEVNYCAYFSPIQVIKDKNKKMVQEDIVFPAGVNIHGIFHILFAQPSTFIYDYHTKRGDVKIEMNPWVSPADKTTYGFRDFQCITTVKAPWSTQTKYVEWERYDMTTVGGVPTLFVRICGSTPLVTLGDAFRVEALLEIKENTTNQQCSMSIYGYVQFLRSTWMAGKIESTALQQESPVAYKLFSQMAVERVKEKMGGVKSKGASTTAPPPAGGVLSSAAQQAISAEQVSTTPSRSGGGGGGDGGQFSTSGGQSTSSATSCAAPPAAQYLPPLQALRNAVFGGDLVHGFVLFVVMMIMLFLVTGWGTSVGYDGAGYQQAVVNMMRYQTYLLVFIVMYLVLGYQQRQG
eukprot:PhF_6_TR44249/c0_g1_i2/m.68072